MPSRIACGLFAAAVISLAGIVHAENIFTIDTLRTTYSGTVTRFATLADANANVNATGGPHALTNRPAVEPAFQQPYRDLALFFTKNTPSYYSDSNYFLTNWYEPSGNPSGTAVGFVQLPDDPAAYDHAATLESFADAQFIGSGSGYGVMRLSMNGVNTLVTSGGSPLTRLWAAPGGTAPGGVFHSWDLFIELTGLAGNWNGALIEANNHPTGASGYFRGVFEDTVSTTGFYRFDFSVGLENNWLFGTQTSPPASFFAALPEPTGFATGVVISVAIISRRYRRV